AMSLSNVNSLTIEQVPAPSTFADTIETLLAEAGAAPVAKMSSPLNRIAAEIDALNSQLRALNDPRSVYTRMPYGLEGL
ncbi:MAG: hypothetical protein ABF325_04845, partial [Lentimonas sp.]